MLTIQQNVGEQWTNRTSLWHAFMAFDQFTVYTNRCTEPLTDKTHRFTTVYFAVKQFKQKTVINLVEEILQVDVHYPLISIIDMVLSFQHCLMKAAVRPEAETTVRELKLKSGHDDLKHCLLKQTVCNRWDAKQTSLSVAFRYLHAQDGLWKVLAGTDFFNEGFPVYGQKLRKLCHGHMVNSSRTVVLLDLMHCLQQVATCKNLLNHSFSFIFFTLFIPCPA